MSSGPDRQFLLSVFLMEAWDTVGEIERHASLELPGNLEQLLVLTHRLKGAAALNGFPGVSALASAMEEIVEAATAASADDRPRASGLLEGLIADLKTALDGIGAGGAENTRALIATATAHVPERGPRLGELARFFADNGDVLEYFGPEALEHLDAMTASLSVLEREGASEAELAALFRAVHTLKGAAYTVGCRVVGDFAHRIEDLLGAVRDSLLPLTPAVIEAVDAGIEALRGMLTSATRPQNDLGVVVERATRLLEALPISAEVTALSPVAPSPESADDTAAPHPFVPALSRAALAARPVADSVSPRPSIRVNLERLDALMNLVGELVIARSRLERRLTQFERVSALLGVSQSRMTRVVRDFEDKYLDPHLPERREPALSDIENFGPLEFDRYDDFNILARSVGEIANDISEIQAQLAVVVRSVREDAANVQRLTGDVRSEITRARMVPIGRLLARFSRRVREAARMADKTVTLEISGEAVEVDNTIVEQIADPLLHLVQNAVAHGLEPEAERIAAGKPAAGTVYLRAYQKGSSVYVEVADDGRGIDIERVRNAAVEHGFVRADAAPRMSPRELLDLIFLPGFSTAPRVTATAGRGVGMDVVRTNVTRLGGDVDVETEVGVGTRFTLRLPLVIAVSDAFLIRVGEQVMAVPVAAVQQVLRVARHDIRTTDGIARVMVDDRSADFIALHRVLGLPCGPDRSAVPTIVLRVGRRLLAVAVDDLLGKEEIVVKSLGAFLDDAGPYAGATISGDGRVILLLDPARLAERDETADVAGETATVPAQPVEGARRVLLVDDSISVRKFVGQMLERAGFSVVTANDGAEALQLLGDMMVDVVVTDLEMPRVNGYELIRDLRRRPTMRDLPIIALTTRAGDKHVRLAHDLGVTHYVTKPLDEATFVRLVDTVVAPPAAVGASS